MNHKGLTLYTVVSERKGHGHPLHDFVVKAGLGIRATLIPAEREPWMNDQTWAEASANNHWRVTIYRHGGASMTTVLNFGTHRVWKEGAKAAAPTSLQPHITDFTNIGFAGDSDRHREFIERWSEPEPPCIEEAMETLIADAKNVEDNLTRRQFVRRFPEHSEAECSNAWNECVKCRRHLRRLLTKSEYHSLLAWSYAGDEA